MKQGEVAQELARLLEKAREKTGKLAAGAGEKVFAHASRAAMKRGLVDRPVTLDEGLAAIRALRDRGGLSREEFDTVRRELVKRFRGG